MKIFLLIFLALGVGLLSACWWGLYTGAGRAAFPEMAGILPFFFGVLGGAIVLLTGLIFLFRRYRRRS